MIFAFTPGAWKDWNKLDKKIRARLAGKLAAYSKDPFRYSIKLTDTKIGQYRFRIGEYRIIFDVIENEIIILAVGHRRDIYKA